MSEIEAELQALKYERIDLMNQNRRLNDENNKLRETSLKYFNLMQANSEVVQDNISITQEHQSIVSIREWLNIMKDEPKGLIELTEVYHSIRRMIGDE